MEEIIEKVIEIDNKAKRFTRQAEDRKEGADKYIQAQRILIKSESDKTLANDLANEQKRLDMQTKAKLMQAEKQEAAELDRLDKFYEQNKARLVAQVFNEVLK